MRPRSSLHSRTRQPFHEFRIEQRVGKEVRMSTLSAQIVKIEEGVAETPGRAALLRKSCVSEFQSGVVPCGF